MSACAFIAKMGKMLIILVFVSACILTGCSIASTHQTTSSASFEPVNTITMQVAITDTPSSSPSSTRTPFPIPTKTFTLTQTSSATATTRPAPPKTKTRTATATSEVIPQSCFEIEGPTKSGVILEGKLLRLCAQGFCTLAMKNQQLIEVPINPTKLDMAYPNLAISPDRKWLAYENTDRDMAGEILSTQLRIVSAAGKVKPVIGWNPGWRLYGWQNDNVKLFADRWNGDDHYIVLFDPGTGKAQETLLPALRDPYPGDLILKDARENYDSTFTRVVYLYAGYSPSHQDTYVLWDVQ